MPNDWDDGPKEESPARRAARSVHHHDGFYFRVSLGAGYLSTGLEGGGAGHLDMGGASVDIDLMLGATPIPGLVIGGAYFFDQAPSPTVSQGARSGTLDYSLNFGVIGAFVDAFPNPSGGLHLGGIFGLSAATLSSTGGGTAAAARGFGGGGFFGYDGWIGDQWALGGFARVMAGSVSDSAGGEEETLSPVTYAFTLSLLNH
jgi:hypothetical protein